VVAVNQSLTRRLGERTNSVELDSPKSPSDSLHSGRHSNGSRTVVVGAPEIISPLGSPKGEFVGPTLSSSEGERMSRHSSVAPPVTPDFITPRESMNIVGSTSFEKGVNEDDEVESPTELNVRPESLRKPKILAMMGREVGPTKAMSRLGSTTFDRNSMRMADEVCLYFPLAILFFKYSDGADCVVCNV